MEGIWKMTEGPIAMSQSSLSSEAFLMAGMSKEQIKALLERLNPLLVARHF